MDNWISVDDRLPAKNGVYLCWGVRLSTEVTTLSYEDLTWFWTEDWDSASGVSHWQPLPPPPETKQ